MKPIITLTTDWNKHDFYAGALKGRILQAHEEVRIIDITHQIKPLNIPEAAFILRNSYSHFPKGTLHILSVKSVPEKDQHHILVVKDGHYFLGTDNGVFGLMFPDEPEKIIRLEVPNTLTTFPTMGVFTEVIKKLMDGVAPEELGDEQSTYYKRIPLRPTIDESVIIGRVVYIDSFHNAITNISRDLFQRVANQRKYQIFVQSNSNKINRSSKSYHDTQEGELLALFNSLDLLEIAMSGGNAAQILSLDTDSTVRIRFY